MDEITHVLVKEFSEFFGEYPDLDKPKYILEIFHQEMNLWKMMVDEKDDLKFLITNFVVLLIYVIYINRFNETLFTAFPSHKV